MREERGIFEPSWSIQKIQQSSQPNFGKIILLEPLKHLALIQTQVLGQKDVQASNRWHGNCRCRILQSNNRVVFNSNEAY